MSSLTDLIPGLLTFLTGFASSTAFVLALFIGFCVFVGFTKTKKTTGHDSVVKSLDESVSHQAVEYLSPTAPRGQVDQLKVW